MAACKKEEKWLPAIMDSGKLMHIRMELTPVLVSGVEADTPNKRKRREYIFPVGTMFWPWVDANDSSHLGEYVHILYSWTNTNSRLLLIFFF